jgi:hypothetical protein
MRPLDPPAAAYRSRDHVRAGWTRCSFTASVLVHTATTHVLPSSRGQQPRARDDVQAELLEQRDRIKDHVKNHLYEKLGVASRQELVARVFLDEYLPEVVRQTPLTSRRRFDRE